MSLTGKQETNYNYKYKVYHYMMGKRLQTHLLLYMYALSYTQAKNLQR